MRKGACFICKETGYLAQDHRKQMEKGNDLLQKMKGKELHAHVRALLAQMEEDDKEEFFADARRSGFLIRRSGLMSVSPLLDIYSVTTTVINSNKLSIPI